MKILEKGRPQKGWATEARCTGNGNGGGGCGAKLLVEQGDLFTTSSSSRDETTVYVTFRCVACGVLTDLPDHIVPASVRSALPTRAEFDCSARD